ncbi:MAG: site-2 protease family protein [Myxococcota bacterium]|jgi:membrane-associated protease RseP (regulator of RpoE activity)|nr:site-2 protease family protein [Myxococcota bacterium]
MKEPLSAPGKAPRDRLWLHAVLFLSTCLTTWFAGFGGADMGSAVVSGLQYMGSIMAILLAHEMGHYVAARKRDVPASLPFFIPLPIGPIGTFGAVISMKGRIKTRNGLMEVGAAGPLCGLLVTLPILFVGLRLSPVGPLPEGGAILEGNSALYWVLKRWAVGDIPSGQDVWLHPMAWAGWVGLWLTALNLLPIGQLDGGHILYALSKKRHGIVSQLFHFGLFFFGAGLFAYRWLGARTLGLDTERALLHAQPGLSWMLLAGLLLLLHRISKGQLLRHPPTDDDVLSLGHRIIGFVCIALLVLTFAPAPLEILGD